MRTLLICAGVFLTAGTFVAAERLTSAADQTFADEIQAAAKAAADEEIKRSIAKIAAFKDETKSAQTQLAKLTADFQDAAAARDDLAAQVATAEDRASSALQDLQELETANLKLTDRLDIRDASLKHKNAQIASLTQKVATLAESAENASQQPRTDSIDQKRVAALYELLATRNETIAELKKQINSGETASVAENGDDANAALLKELEAATALIEELNKAADASNAKIAELGTNLSERDAQVAELENLVNERVAADIAGALEGGNASELSDDAEGLALKLENLAALVESQSKTISNLRMGFEDEPASTMEMASACIERANKIFEISQIKFSTGTSSISEQSISTLDHLRDLAIGCESEEMYIEIGGHTDSLGAESSNQALSEARAASVRTFLIGRGIPEETMVAVGFGEAQPIASNDTLEGRAQNRRITFTWKMREETPVDVETSSDIVDG